jgi:hypothetical protein
MNEDTHTLCVTYTGRIIDLSSIKEFDICLVDIAHHLANKCRYGGALRFEYHYSVAQHSILLCEYILKEYKDNNLAKIALLHDASEYLLDDLLSGLKPLLPDYQKLEEQLFFQIYEKYKVNLTIYDYEKIIKVLDKRILLDETKEFLPNHYKVIKETYKHLDSLGVKVVNECCNVCMLEIEMKFLTLCKKLGIED